MPSDWERIADDPERLAAARARYEGSGDLADQLWWQHRPGSLTPSGVEDPSAVLERERQALYRPGGAGGDAKSLDSRRRQIAADQASAAAAVAATLAPEQAPPTVSETRATPWRTIAVAAALGLLAGAAVTAAVIGRQAQSPGSVEALAVFAEPVRTVDRPSSEVLPALLEGATIRHLKSYSSIGLSAYGVRTQDGAICLLTVVLGTRATAACTTPDSFASSGVTWIGTASADPVDDLGRRPSEEVRLVWGPRATISITPLSSR